MTEEHIGYFIIYEEQEEHDGKLEWREAETHLYKDGSTSDAPLDDYVRVAHEMSTCDDVRNVRLVEVLQVEREILQWLTA